MHSHLNFIEKITFILIHFFLCVMKLPKGKNKLYNRRKDVFELGYFTHLECISNITKHQHPEIKHFFTNHRQGYDW